MVARKKGPCPGDNMRFYIGYGALNDATIEDKLTLPNVNKRMDDMAGLAYYSILDGFSGYYSIQLDGKSISLTAFLTPRGIARWTVLPFGLKNVPCLYTSNGSSDDRVASDRVVCGRHWSRFSQAI